MNDRSRMLDKTEWYEITLFPEAEGRFVVSVKGKYHGRFIVAMASGETQGEALENAEVAFERKMAEGEPEP